VRCSRSASTAAAARARRICPGSFELNDGLFVAVEDEAYDLPATSATAS
jgi:hypothetical protein